MIKFLFKGILKDRSRSLLPIIVVSLGVMFTVLLHCWITGIMGEAVVMNANFNNGHVKLMTRAYAEESDQMPNDLAILGVAELDSQLRSDNPDMEWVNRIRFGAIIDFPDSVGETRDQGPVVGWAMDLFSPESKEIERFNIPDAIQEGNIPIHPSEALISSELAQKFNVKLGDKFTLFGSTMDGSMAFKNFNVVGTVRFGAAAIDRGAIITDITDAQDAFHMQDAAGEILGFFPSGQYDDERATEMASAFNAKYEHSDDEFAPAMFTFSQQEGMADMLELTGLMRGVMIFVFVMAMSVVLWNAGLIGSLRRYNEFGVRLALGEMKGHIYKTLIYEGILVGAIGTVFGTILGLLLSYLIQVNGLDISGMMKSSSLMIPSVVRTTITPTAFYIGIIPGIFSMVLGNALAGIGIYKRQTARLFNELEV